MNILPVLMGPIHLATTLAGGEITPPVVDPTVPVVVPDPAETVVTLGDLAGSVVVPRLVAGADLRLALRLRNAGAAAAFDPAATLEAVVTRGGTSGAAFRPAAAWLDPAAGTLAVALGSGQTATLDAGEYRLLVTVASGGERFTALDTRLLVEPAPAPDDARPAWCTDADLARLSPTARDLIESHEGRDTVGFLSVRQSVTDVIRRRFVLAYSPQAGRTLRRQLVPDPIFGEDRPDETAPRPTSRQWASYLSGGGLVLEEGLREAVARLALAEVYDRQPGRAYDDEAAMHRQKAESFLAGYWPQVDADGDGVPDYLAAPSGRLLIYLPEGTSP